MKKIVALLLAVMMVASLASCGAKKEPEAPADVDEPTGAVAGGWTINSEFPEADLPEEAVAAFDKAMEGYSGVGYVPVAYLGSQVVAGTNYAFLCKSTLVTAEPVTKLTTVVIYQDLEKNASVKDTIDFDLAAVIGSEASVEFNPADFVGGFTFDNACGVGLDEDTQKAFDKAAEGLMGVSYTPLALLGTQVVAGRNLAVLCSASAVTAEPSTALAVMVIYADLQGGAQITSISGFNPTK